MQRECRWAQKLASELLVISMITTFSALLFMCLWLGAVFW